MPCGTQRVGPIQKAAYDVDDSLDNTIIVATYIVPKDTTVYDNINRNVLYETSRLKIRGLDSKYHLSTRSYLSCNI